ncbi:hypothetical protein CEXT_277741 [Caerostris extrusa]|uniref:LAGLIDADG homing endonuclease n=1 Tax=Caerostris extrusa TaxID=172846 RepID=A0AAV4NJ39_CAEEX|nr:hypothetical protein CEXT_277741 [Caerostris extrusa]
MEELISSVSDSKIINLKPTQLPTYACANPGDRHTEPTQAPNNNDYSIKARTPLLLLLKSNFPFQITTTQICVVLLQQKLLTSTFPIPTRRDGSKQISQKMYLLTFSSPCCGVLFKLYDACSITLGETEFKELDRLKTGINSRQ